MATYILVLNGPNLNLTGIREPGIYGSKSLDQINDGLTRAFDGKIRLEFAQSNCEGTLIDKIQQAGLDTECVGIVLNAGAYTHYSYAIADAIAAVKAPVVEVHLSNPSAREEFRHRSVIAPVCRGSISGFGATSYVLAINALLSLRG